MYITYYPFISSWASRLLPCPSYCKQCCNDHWGTYVFYNYGFLRIYAQQSSPASQFKSINSPAPSLLCGRAVTSVDKECKA